MTDRIFTLTVVLENYTRDDDAAALCAAIKQMRNVVAVLPNVANPQQYGAEAKAKHELWMKFMDFAEKALKP